MEEKNSIPFIVWEGERARDERRHRRDFIIIVILIVSLLVSNALWIYEWSQYEYSDEIVTVDGVDRGIVNYIGNDGAISYGESDNNSQDTNEKEVK